MLPIVLVSEVSPMASAFMYLLVFFGLIGVLFWVLLIAYYFYAMLFYAVIGFVKFIWNLMGIR